MCVTRERTCIDVSHVAIQPDSTRNDAVSNAKCKRVNTNRWCSNLLCLVDMYLTQPDLPETLEPDLTATFPRHQRSTGKIVLLPTVMITSMHQPTVSFVSVLLVVAIGQRFAILKHG